MTGDCFGTPMQWAQQLGKQHIVDLMSEFSSRSNISYPSLHIDMTVIISRVTHQLSNLTQMEKDLEKALDIRDEILKCQSEIFEYKTKREQILQRSENEIKGIRSEMRLKRRRKRKNRKLVMDDYEEKLTEVKVKYDREINDIESKLKVHDMAMKLWKGHQNYKSDDEIMKLQNKIQDLEMLTEAVSKITLLKSDKKKKRLLKEYDLNLCPICLQRPFRVFSCQGCENWICDQCLEKVTKCPTCRWNIKIKPMRRNKTVERIIKDQ